MNDLEAELAGLETPLNCCKKQANSFMEFVVVPICGPICKTFYMHEWVLYFGNLNHIVCETEEFGIASLALLSLHLSGKRPKNLEFAFPGFLVLFLVVWGFLCALLHVLVLFLGLIFGLG